FKINLETFEVGRCPGTNSLVSHELKNATVNLRVSLDLPPKRRLAVEQQNPAVGDLLRRKRVGLCLVLRGGGQRVEENQEREEVRGSHRIDLREGQCDRGSLYAA